MHVTNKQFSDKFNNGWKKSRSPIYCDFSHFTSIIWPCGRDNMKSFSFILLKFVMHVTRTNSITAEKKSKWPIYCDFLHFTSLIWPCGRNNFKFNNGDELLSSVLLLTYFISQSNHWYCEWIGCLNIKICKCLVSNQTNMSYIQPLEVVDRGSETQPQVGKKKYINFIKIIITFAYFH